MRPPHDLDELMWTLAEEQNATAIDQFTVRYPQFADEMRKRASMVSGLKRAKTVPKSSEPKALPKFQPKPEPESVSPVAVAWVSGLVLTAIGFISFAVSSGFLQPRTPVAVKSSPNDTQVNAFRTEPPVPNTMEIIRPRPNEGLKPEPGPTDVPPIEPTVPKYLQPTNFAVRGARLTDALRKIADQGGLEIVMAPGFPEMTIDVNYTGLNTIQILQSMGSEYAFTAFDQGDGSVIVVPARDPALEATPAANKATGTVQEADAPR